MVNHSDRAAPSSNAIAQDLTRAVRYAGPRLGNW